MAKEKMKVCAFITASTLDDKSRSLPETCKARGCTGKFKIDEDPKCRFFMDIDEAGARAAKTRRRMRKRIPRKHFKR